MNVEDFKKLIHSYGWADLQGKEDIQCGLEGEKYDVCRKCSTNAMDVENFSGSLGMFSRDTFQQWAGTFDHEIKSRQATLTPSRFEIEKDQGDVRSEETIDDFQNRASRNMGEAFLFTNRRLIKMVNFELSIAGHQCFGAVSSLGPGRPPQPRYPDMEKEEWELRALIDGIDSDDTLAKISLNRLGQELKRISDKASEVYNYTDEQLEEYCVREESKKWCPDMRSPEKRSNNPNQWIINMYVDSFVGRWLKAHGKEEIAIDCQGRPKCYQWEGSYSSSYPF
jgi:hypothetical protein